MGSSRGARATLLFDGGCGPCSTFARAVRALDTHRRLDVVPLQDEAARRRFEAAMGPAYWEAFHLIGPHEGETRSGARALEELARTLPAVRPFAPLLFHVPGLRRLPAAAYAAASSVRSCSVQAAQG